MYRMHEKLTWSRRVSNCAWRCFGQYANHLSFPSNWNIQALLQLFNLLHFILYNFYESTILSCELMLSEGKNLKKHYIYNHGGFRFTCTFIYANYPSFSRFRWRQKCHLWFLRCLPIRAPGLFWLTRFFKPCFTCFIPKFQCTKVMTNAKTE